MRKFLYVMLAGSLLFSSVTPVKAEDEETIQEEVIEETSEEDNIVPEEEPVEVTAPVFQYDVNEITVEYGKETELPVLTIEENDYTQVSDVAYSSDNETVAAADETGIVTITGKGTAVITASVMFRGPEEEEEEYTASYTLTVTKPHPVISFQSGTYTNYLNQTFKYPVTLIDNAEKTTINDYTITYTSANPKIVSVNADGTFTTKNFGTTKITATAAKKDNPSIQSSSVSFTVNVVIRPVIPQITANTNTYFTVKWNKTGALKYELQYSRNANFKGSTTKTVVYGNTVSSAKIRKPVKKKTYYVRVRAMRMVNGKKTYSAWTSSKEIFWVTPANITTVQENFDFWANQLTSKTNYLMMIDITNCYTAIYQKKNGKFVRKYLWQCAPGKKSTPSVTGTYKVIKKKKGFISYGERVWYATGFTSHRYTHSVSYRKEKSRQWEIMDGRVGMPISHGCIRLKTENAYWIYKNIPFGTTVHCISPKKLES